MRYLKINLLLLALLTGGCDDSSALDDTDPLSEGATSGDLLGRGGDGDCATDESAAASPSSCLATCGDGECTQGESASACPADGLSSCGDGVCTHDEEARTCPSDCPAVCGDGFVTHSEECEGAAIPCRTSCDSEGRRACLSCLLHPECIAPAESCNGVDDDCDGETDEGYECTPGETISCTTSCGTVGAQRCSAACELELTCEPPLEMCNGFDDDCDGDIDEGCDCASDWSDVLFTHTTSRSMFTIWGSSWDDIYGATQDEILHYDGLTWSAVYSEPQTIFKGIFGLSAESVYAVGQHHAFPRYGVVIHYDGIHWSEIARVPDIAFRQVWGSSEEDIYVVGGQCSVFNFDGSSWRDISPPCSGQIFTAWGSGPGNLFVGGEDSLLRWDGSSWTDYSSIVPGIERILDIHGFAGDDIFICGNNGKIWHFDGREIISMDTGVIENIVDLWGSSPSDLYAVGDNGLVLHYDGIEWTDLSLDPSVDVMSVWSSSENNVFISTGGSTLRHRCGDPWW
jgi:hypothetical protein